MPSSMTIDTISSYHLRKDTLLEYLCNIFPSHSRYITAEAERSHIITNLRELDEDQSETQVIAQNDLAAAGPTDAFLEFIERKRSEYKGRNGYGKEQHYLPRSELFTYWTIARIRDVCESYSEDMSIRCELIKHRYLCVFSTLVYIGQLSFLPAFKRFDLTDNKFPVNTVPGVLEKSEPYIAMFNSFQKNHWMFFPVVLDRDSLDDTLLPPERILPLCFEETIRPRAGNDRAAFTRVCFHPSCNNLIKGDDVAENPAYMLKTYHGEQHEQDYQHEVQAFARLLPNVSSTENVIKCYASFRHGATYNLVMEWIPGGDLLGYFRNTSPPRTAEEIIDFWDSLSKLTVGLRRIHQVVVSGERSDQYQVPYQFLPIIADFGHSHTRHIKDDAFDGPAIDRRGNQMYCAPESSHHSGRSTGSNRIRSDADIFSAGALLSDAASWVANGQDGREEYLRRRQHELVNTEGFLNSGYEAGFHNGSKRLSCVDEMHRDIRSRLPSCDNMTPRVLDVIEKHMMVPQNERLPAVNLCGMFEQHVWNAKRELSNDGGDISDIESVLSAVFSEASINSSISSQDYVALLAVSELATFLVSHEELKSLMGSALSKVGSGRFVRNVSRLLKKYGHNLKSEASTALQHQTATFVRHSARQAAVDLEILLRRPNSNVPLVQSQDAQAAVSDRVDKWIESQGLSSVETPISNPIDDPEEGFSQSDSDDSDLNEPPPATALEAVKDFLSSSRALPNLHNNLREWLGSNQPNTKNEMPEKDNFQELTRWQRLRIWALSIWSPPPVGFHRIPYICSVSPTLVGDATCTSAAATTGVSFNAITSTTQVQSPQYVLLCVNGKTLPELHHIDVMRERRYLYQPTEEHDLDVVIPLDHLLQDGVHTDQYWIKEFPKKLNGYLIRQANDELNVDGWGVQINDRLSTQFIMLWILLMVIVIGLSTMVYALATADNSAAFGLGSFLAALSTIYATYQYFSWKEDLS
ncbi:hypothetical protein J7T55_005879 [Diaporthe amygdali]|uniref:uncharacterized protein n=1 Tax=Phomopsis amygdali TaxID=1214568 RepID=UPI0022FF3345|nr:uncharacterized protein J7T55_005879 [Diaporthe amygdali]KAJ0124541.1 hypothetical protein J7T55_005879 [Diaporthe amygdali]